MPTPRRRRWFQFGIGTTFVVMTVFAGFLAYHVNWIRQRHAVLENGIPYHLVPGKAPGFLRLFGEQGYSEICVLPANNQNPTPSEERRESERVARIFPEAKSVYVLNPYFGVSR